MNASNPLTIFACPRPFVGHFNIIQRNAIRSWTLLEPMPKILLLGNEGGTEEVCQEFGLTHIPNLLHNEFGTPILSDIFLKAEKFSQSTLLCYVNADIILMSDFMKYVELLKNLNEKFLGAGGRWNYDLDKALNFEQNWAEKFRQEVYMHGINNGASGIDYFIFPRGFWGNNLPPFALGRFYWDNWILYYAKKTKAKLIDLSKTVMAVHQNHPYPQTTEQTSQNIKQEANKNLILAGGERHIYSLLDADLCATADGFKINWRGKLRINQIKYFLQTKIWHSILTLTRPLRNVIGLTTKR